LGAGGCAFRPCVRTDPRIVEAAAQRHASTPIVSTNGSPASTVLLLPTQLLEAGADLRYHGDFDTAGFAICERMMRLGLAPWRMSTVDYRAALAAADVECAVLPRETLAPGATPWDPALQEEFGQERRIVHQERLLLGLVRMMCTPRRFHTHHRVPIEIGQRSGITQRRSRQRPERDESPTRPSIRRSGRTKASMQDGSLARMSVN
jgi:hypothetical protein